MGGMDTSANTYQHRGVRDDAANRPNDVVDAAPASTALTLPLDKAVLAGLRAGDAVTLTGPLYTLRDAGHIRLLEELRAAGGLPYGLSGQAIFYAGPTPAAAGRPFGAVGPTTASRMDFAAPELYDAGVAATVGKGVRSQAVKDACVRNGAVYFVTVGGAAAYLAKCVVSSEVLAYEDLGTEALRRIEVRDLPAFVGVDAHGADAYELACEGLGAVAEAGRPVAEAGAHGDKAAAGVRGGARDRGSSTGEAGL